MDESIIDLLELSGTIEETSIFTGYFERLIIVYHHLKKNGFVLF
jgi:hypothetical protein